jgi:hypothetical protein
MCITHPAMESRNQPTNTVYGPAGRLAYFVAMHEEFCGTININKEEFYGAQYF